MEFDYMELDLIKKATRILMVLETEQSYLNGFSTKYPEAKIEMLEKIIEKCDKEQNTFYPTKLTS
jgi:hypothetical protein